MVEDVVLVGEPVDVYALVGRTPRSGNGRSGNARSEKTRDKIDYDWLNLSFNTFKIKCKNLFLTFSMHVVYFDQLLGNASKY